ncbi:DUF4097 family beta strand repeat-containing protein [Robertkochia flava]|uniref:hypothetical protein n=1 Tax=Robertkochia flava TaxID=3447986 RepID=UPI001CCE5FC9|nr:hypothetical protein [Robertkochia marina]
MFHKRIRPQQGRFFMLCCLCCFSVFLHAQKRLERVYDVEFLTKIQIDAEKIYQVELESVEVGHQVWVETFIEGEYQAELTVSSRQEGSTLFLEGVFIPSFENPNDKLSAHKVLSVSLKVKVPRQLMVELFGSSTRVVAKGNYNDLDISTRKGPVFLENVEGLVKVKTANAEIRATRLSGYVQAATSYGKVYRGKVRSGNSSISLESVNGDIYINKEE